MASAKDVDTCQHCQVSLGPRMSVSFSSERTTVSPPAEKPAGSEGHRSPRTGCRSGKGKKQVRGGLKESRASSTVV